MRIHIAVILVLCGSVVEGAPTLWDYLPTVPNIMSTQPTTAPQTTFDDFDDDFEGSEPSTPSGPPVIVEKKVELEHLVEFAESQVAPGLEHALPYESCVPGVDVHSTHTFLMLDKSILRMRPHFTTGVNIIDNTGEQMDIEIYFEFKKARMQYSFRFKNDIVLYNLDKSGKLLLTQRGTFRVSLFGKTTKLLSTFNDLLEHQTSCVVHLEKVNATVGGELERTKIKYYSFGIGFTQKIIGGIVSIVEDEVQQNLARAVSYLVEKEVRKLGVFCAPEKELEDLKCGDSVYRSLVVIDHH